MDDNVIKLCYFFCLRNVIPYLFVEKFIRNQNIVIMLLSKLFKSGIVLEDIQEILSTLAS